MTQFKSFFQQNRGDIRKQRKAITEALAQGPATITELANRTELPKDLIVWNIVGLLRWGSVEIAGENGCELVYARKEVAN
ncbi:MAG: hypothetical protein K9W43_11155 [Candidatus Thorarchaeota archaeon]|nr:hypothetical protein [Candidatus Thorarchaeota archaeon]